MKATEIVALDVKKICSFTDIIVLCTGTSRTHLRALVARLDEALRERGIRPLGVEGLDTGWVVLDYGDVVAHVFTHESRLYYNLERLWGDGNPVEWRARKTRSAGAKEKK